MLSGELIKYSVTLLAITNPIGNLAIFIGLTGDKTESERRRIALQTALATAIVLIVVTWLGEPILKLFGISIPAFKIAGGLVISLLGLSMLSSQPSGMTHTQAEQDSAHQKDSIAVVPLAIPIIAGPGAMTTVIVYMGEHIGVLPKIGASVINIAIAGFVALTFCFATRISKIMGVSGVKIAVRVMGLILIAMAMSLLLSGLQSAFPGLT